MKKVLIGIFLCLVPVFIASLVIGGPTYTNRERTKSAPMHINYESGDTDWAAKITDSSDIQRWRIQHDGSNTIFDSTGATVYSLSTATAGIANISASTLGPAKNAIAILSGSTGTLAWAASSSGASGWHLTENLMRTYKTFDVETQHPGGLVSGATQYSDNCQVGIGKSGETIYLTGRLTTNVHGMRWTFVQKGPTGSTPFVLYDANGRFNGGSGTTENPAGDATVRTPEDVADSITLEARFTPSATSGWYVTNMWYKD